jgi:hypothetical protein
MLFSFNATPISQFLGKPRTLQTFDACKADVQLRAVESVLRSCVDDG